MKNALVLNMGMKSIRSIVFSETGEKLGTAACPVQTILNAECVEQDPNEWWAKAAQVIRASLVDVGKENIDYITVTASSSCLVCVDKNGDSLDKCIMVSDRRAVAETEKIKNAQSYLEMGKTVWGLEASFMLPKILWIKNNKPEIYENTHKFLSPNDFLIGKMTNEFFTDIFNAQKYLYDLNKNSYPIALIKELGLKTESFPEVVSPGKIIGKLTEKACDFLGLSRRTSVVLSTYDAICSFFGSGVSEEGEASDVSGTVTVFRALSKKTSLKPSASIFVTPYQEQNLTIVGGSNNLGGGLIEWVKQCYYLNEQYPYEVMEKDANNAKIGSDGLIFLPYLLGERAPVWNNDARGVFFGLERTHTRNEMTRAVFESAGFIDLDMIKAIEDTGIKITRIRLSGGLARIDLVSQIKSDITGRDVLVLSEFETTAAGAAMLVFIGVGVFDDLKQASDIFASVRMVIKSNGANHAKYQKLYTLYKDCYENMKDLFKKRSEMVAQIYQKHEIRIENM